MLARIIIALTVVLSGFVIVVMLQPSDFQVVRAAVIPAPPAVVFDQVNNLKKWNEWSPWARLDPAAKNEFTGARGWR